MQTRKRKKGSQLVSIINPIIFLATAVYFLLALFFLVSSAFEASFQYGLRSIGACLLPPIIMIFLNAYTAVFEAAKRNRNVNLFIIYGLFTMMVLVLGSTWQFNAIPLMELLLSALFTSILKRMKKSGNTPQLYACCYGFVIGVLGFTSLFGISPL
jgi:hypothetical protein